MVDLCLRILGIKLSKWRPWELDLALFRDNSAFPTAVSQKFYAGELNFLSYFLLQYLIAQALNLDPQIFKI